MRDVRALTDASTVRCGGDGAHARGAATTDAPRTTRTTRGAGARATCVETLDDGRVVVGDARRARAGATRRGRGRAARGAVGSARARTGAGRRGGDARGRSSRARTTGDVVAWATPREGDGGGAELRELGRLTLASAERAAVLRR